MNRHQENALGILEILQNSYGIVGVKSSFEDEGASFQELVKLRQMTQKVSCELHLKIGGPEAVRDLRDALTLGVDKIVAPMVESPFALAKFVCAYDKYFKPFSSQEIPIGINIETINALGSLDKILNDKHSASLESYTIGRSDLVFSLGKNQSNVNDSDVCNLVEKHLQLIKEKKFKCYMGGSISKKSIPFIEKMYFSGVLDCIETRHIIFDLSKSINKLDMALVLALQFEIELLKGKNFDYYSKYTANLERLQVIDNRSENQDLVRSVTMLDDNKVQDER